MPDTLLDWLARVFPTDRLLTHAGALAPYESDGLTTFRARPRAVVLVESTDEVVRTVKSCHDAVCHSWRAAAARVSPAVRCPIEDGIVIALNRLNRILRLDPDAAHRGRRAGRGQPGRHGGAARTACTTRPTRRASRSARSAATSPSIPAARIASNTA